MQALIRSPGYCWPNRSSAATHDTHGGSVMEMVTVPCAPEHISFCMTVKARASAQAERSTALAVMDRAAPAPTFPLFFRSSLPLSCLVSV